MLDTAVHRSKSLLYYLAIMCAASHKLLPYSRICKNAPQNYSKFMDDDSSKVPKQSIHVPLKCSLPCDSRSQIHKSRLENQDTRSFFQQVDYAERDLDLLLCRSKRHIDKTVSVVHHQTERLRQLMFGQMVTAINQKVELSRLRAQQAKKLGGRKRATDMTATDCQQHAQTQVDLLKMQTSPEEFLQRITKRSSAYMYQQDSDIDRTTRALASCRTRLDKLDFQFMGPCPRNGLSDKEVKEELRGLFDSL